MSDRQLFLIEGVLLLTVGIPLSLAEGTPLYWLVTLLALLVGWYSTVRKARPWVRPFYARLLIITAFAALVLEYFWSSTVPVLALSHFMILVCACKLMGERTLRDHTQILVLSLLLLVVSAIVSEHVLFLVVLLVYLGAGITGLIGFHLLVERSRVETGNARIGRTASPTADSGVPPPRALLSATGSISLSAVLVGVLLFVTFPRVGAGALGRLAGNRGAMAVTGFASSLNFRTIGPIQQSDQPVMRVTVAHSDGTPVAPESPLYFRGVALVQYFGGEEPPGGNWLWRRVAVDEPRPREIELQTGAGLDELNLLADGLAPEHDGWVEQEYRLETARDQYLFTCYPAIELEFASPQLVRFWPDSAVLQVQQSAERVVRYAVRSLRRVSPENAELLAESRRRYRCEPPAVVLPVPPLPEELRIRSLIDEITTGIAERDGPVGRYLIASRIMEYLRSRTFTYTLSPPPVAPNREPIGAFLFEHQRGHCEYFASAMAVMCQLSGIPARVVNGYRSDEYNTLGGFHVVRRKDAHAWVEVFIPTRDWVTFDPTPSAPEQGMAINQWLLTFRALADYLQFQWSDRVVAYGSDQRRELLQQFEDWIKRPARNQQTLIGGVAAFIRELFGWRLSLTTQERLIYWVFALLVLVLVLLLSYVMVVVLRRLLRRVRAAMVRRSLLAARHSGAEFYDRFCRALAVLGLRRRADETPAEFADSLARRYPALEPARQVIAVYYAVVFGRHRPSHDECTRIDDFLRMLRRMSRESLSG